MTDIIRAFVKKVKTGLEADLHMKMETSRDPGYEPHWPPLEEAIGLDRCRDFMYMGSAQGADGTPVYLYKHAITRRYINLSDDGRAWKYEGDGTYTEADRTDTVREALTWVE